VGFGKSQPAADDIEAEIEELKRVTDKVVALGNKVIAHNDENKPAKLPTFAEVSEAITYLEVLVKRYKDAHRSNEHINDGGVPVRLEGYLSRCLDSVNAPRKTVTSGV
jgi:hypothetical protein